MHNATGLLCVRLAASSLERSLAFYRNRLGMAVSPLKTEPGYRVGFAPDSNSDGQAGLELRPAPRSRIPSRDDTYWKIGITIPDVDVARTRLLQAGVDVSDAAQFLDVGYVCHLEDPDGYEIELLQHDFADHHQSRSADPSLALGSRPTLGQITLRIAEPEAALAFYRDQLGMRLLSRQVIEPHGFTLYFLAFTDDVPPHTDIDSVANREWLWKRPYTTLELQHRPDAPAPRASDDAGFGGLEIAARFPGDLVAPGGVPIHLSPRGLDTPPGGRYVVP